MNSTQRHEARYQRRKAKREERQNVVRSRITYERVFTYRRLYRSYQICRRGVAWKTPVQKYIAQAPLEVYETQRALMKGKFKTGGYHEFDVYERGKCRHIQAVPVRERVVQRCLCDYAIIPGVESSFIYDNGACRKNKGYHFAIRRLVCHLQRHYRKHGQEGYILLFDFSKFFNRISHRLLHGILEKKLPDKRIRDLTEQIIGAYGDVGLGLGSQISQTLALASADPLDHAVKTRMRIKGYGRYNDDGYLIHHDKGVLETCLEYIRQICRELGIVLNERKTRIAKLSHGFTWLKTRFYLLPGGRVLRKICKRNVTRIRQKFKRLRVRLTKKLMTFEPIRAVWESFRAYAAYFSAWHTIQSVQKLFMQLFGAEVRQWNAARRHHRKGKHEWDTSKQFMTA